MGHLLPKFGMCLHVNVDEGHHKNLQRYKKDDNINLQMTYKKHLKIQYFCIFTVGRDIGNKQFMKIEERKKYIKTNSIKKSFEAVVVKLFFKKNDPF